jgi:ribose 5-phosphate isomerase B
MIIAVASDHGGFELKNRVREHLKERGIKVVDLGTDSEESVDYPVYGKACAEAVASGKADLGVVCCGTGIGISIAANKVKGIRCGLCTSVEMAELTKKHNNANMIALGGRTTDPDLALRIVDRWLDTDFEGGRHQRRVDMLDEM